MGRRGQDTTGNRVGEWTGNDGMNRGRGLLAHIIHDGSSRNRAVARETGMRSCEAPRRT
ncbi:MAG: hypothetical protein K0S58_10 [Nitrospira sp.]|jgi:hypothetical protein|nr:hypothetical protein [Nitrospira sp.]